MIKQGFNVGFVTQHKISNYEYQEIVGSEWRVKQI